MRPIACGQTARQSFWRIAAFVLTSVRIETQSGRERTPLGYCRECRKKVNIRDPKRSAFKNSRPAVQYACPQCGTKVFVVG